MAELDNKKMWVSIINRLNNCEDGVYKCFILDALKDQGFEYKDGEIVSIEPDSQRMVSDKAKEELLPNGGLSEDEKIRKEIKAFIKSRGSQITQSKTDTWIAWLEKQGKQKPVNENFNETLPLSTFEKARRAKEALGQVTYLTEEESRKIDQAISDALGLTINGREASKGEILQHQKPVVYNEADSELECREWVEKYYQGQPFEIKDMIAHGYLAGRVNAFMDAEQEAKEKYKPVEWSEEDEKKCDLLIKQLDALKCSFGLNFKDAIAWLKSLRPQKQWKPSEEQMENLSRASNGGTYRTSLLMELYQQLKKLREE